MNEDKYCQLMATIVAGLLSSGHYTDPDPNPEGTPLKRYDVGEDWKEFERPHRFCTEVVEDAEIIYQEIIYSFREEELLTNDGSAL
jgi:hypothetical protein